MSPLKAGLASTIILVGISLAADSATLTPTGSMPIAFCAWCLDCSSGGFTNHSFPFHSSGPKSGNEHACVSGYCSEGSCWIVTNQSPQDGARVLAAIEAGAIGEAARLIHESPKLVVLNESRMAVQLMTPLRSGTRFRPSVA